MIKWILLCFSILTFSLSLFSLPGDETDIFLSSGLTVHILNHKEVNEDWKDDFEKYKSHLMKTNKISDYLDLKSGFSDDEKAYWILEVSKSKNVRNNIQANELFKDINTIYFLQKIILSTKGKINPDLQTKLIKNIQKIYPSQLSLKDINLIKNMAAVDYMVKIKKNSHFALLDNKSKMIIASFLIKPNDKTKTAILKRYKDLMQNYGKSIKTYNEYLSSKKLKTEKKNRFEKEDNSKKSKHKDIKSFMLKDISDSLKTADNFISFVYYLKDTDLINKTLDYRKLFLINLEKNYPNFKSLSQSQDKA